MKKTFVIGLAFLLVIATIGITINKHYSHGKLFSVALYGEAESCCTDCDCCHDETITIKLQDDYIYSSSDEELPNFSQPITFICDDFIQVTSSAKASKFFLNWDKSPPIKDFSEEHTQIFLL